MLTSAQYTASASYDAAGDMTRRAATNTVTCQDSLPTGMMMASDGLGSETVNLSSSGSAIARVAQ